MKFLLMYAKKEIIQTNWNYIVKNIILYAVQDVPPKLKMKDMINILIVMYSLFKILKMKRGTNSKKISII